MKEQRVSLLEKTELFVLDMDGTFYLGERILEGALEFLQTLKETGRRYLFFTNNSSKSSESYIEKLRRMDCSIDSSQIMTSGDVMIEYLKHYYPGKTVYLLGTPTLCAYLSQAGTGVQLHPGWGGISRHPSGYQLPDRGRIHT